MWCPLIARPWLLVLSSFLFTHHLAAEKAPTVPPLTSPFNAILSRRFYYWFTKPKPLTLDQQAEKLKRETKTLVPILALQQQATRYLQAPALDNLTSSLMTPRDAAVVADYYPILTKIAPLFQKSCFTCAQKTGLCVLTLYPDNEVTGAKRIEFLVTPDECLQVIVMRYEQRRSRPFTDDGDFNDTECDCSVYRECGRYPSDNTYAIYLQAANALIQERKRLAAPQ